MHLACTNNISDICIFTYVCPHVGTYVLVVCGEMDIFWFVCTPGEHV